MVFTFTTNSPGGQVTAGDTRGGVAFGPGDTAYFKTGGGTTLRYASFDLATTTSAILSSTAMPAGLSGFGPLDSAVAGNLLAAIQVNTATNSYTVPQNLYLFDITAKCVG